MSWRGRWKHDLDQEISVQKQGTHVGLAHEQFPAVVLLEVPQVLALLGALQVLVLLEVPDMPLA